MSKEIKNPSLIAQFVFAGDAIFTVVSKATGTRFTYRFTRAKGKEESRPWFASVLSGSNNESDYSYMACVFGQAADAEYRTTAKSKVGADAPSSKGAAWLVETLRRFAEITLAGPSAEDAGDKLASVLDRFGKIEFFHEDRCGRCGRTLTVPESIEAGIGPDCAEKMGL